MSRTALLATATAAIEGYNEWTTESIMGVRAPNCIHQVLPLSMGRPPLNNDQYLAQLAPIMPAFHSYHVTIKKTIVDEEAKQVVLHVESAAETEMGDYDNEYILVLGMTENGRKVQRFEEFVDSKSTADVLPRLRGWLAGKKGMGHESWMGSGAKPRW